MKIALTSPTGNIGRKLVQKLIASNEHDLVLLARNPEKLKEEKSRGASIVQGDLEDTDFLKRSTAGVDTLFLLIPPKVTSDDARGRYRSVAKSAVDAVEHNGIKRTVFLSSIAAHLEQGTGIILASHDAEAELSRSLQNLTILRPAFFMENFFMSLGGIQQAGSIFLPVSGDIKVPMIATDDIANAAAWAVTDTKTTGVRIIPLHGTRDYSFNEVADIIGREIGTGIKHVKVSKDQAMDSLTGLGVSDHVASLFLEMYDGIESGHLKDESPRSAESTTTTSFEDFAKSVLAPALKSAATS